jgi:hypothetical protein
MRYAILNHCFFHVINNLLLTTKQILFLTAKREFLNTLLLLTLEFYCWLQNEYSVVPQNFCYWLQNAIKLDS